MSLEADSENEAATPDGGNGINRLSIKETLDRRRKEQIPILSAHGSQGLTRQQKEQIKGTESP